MKNREEYKASIFAKRDALLAKRRKRISQTAAALSIIICFAVAFAFLPKRISTDFKITEEMTGITVQTAAVTEPNTTAHIEDAEGEAYTFLSVFSEQAYTKPHYSQKQFAATGYAGEVKKETSTASATETESYEETEIAAEAEKTTKRGFGGFRPEYWDAESFFTPGENIVNPDSSPDYTTEEIAKKAKTYLDSETADKVIDKHTVITVNHTSDGDTYTAWFYTDTEQVKVELDSESLELIEISKKELADNVQTSPAYIPTTAKPAYTPTTAAPAYMPE